MHLTFSLVSSESLPLLQKLAKSTFAAAFESQNNPEDFEQYLESAFSLETLAEENETNGTYFYFANLGERVIGYFKINEFNAQTELQEQHGIELERIYLVEQYQSNGFGKQILQKVESIARQKSKSYLWLGVWECNTDAIKFYERHGFIKFDTHPYFIGNDEQTDWLMKKTL